MAFSRNFRHKSWCSSLSQCSANSQKNSRHEQQPHALTCNLYDSCKNHHCGAKDDACSSAAIIGYIGRRNEGNNGAQCHSRYYQTFFFFVCLPQYRSDCILRKILAFVNKKLSMLTVIFASNRYIHSGIIKSPFIKLSLKPVAAGEIRIKAYTSVSRRSSMFVCSYWAISSNWRTPPERPPFAVRWLIYIYVHHELLNQVRYVKKKGWERGGTVGVKGDVTSSFAEPDALQISL